MLHLRDRSRIIIVSGLEKLLRIKLNCIGLWLQYLQSFLSQLPVVKIDTFMQLGKYNLKVNGAAVSPFKANGALPKDHSSVTQSSRLTNSMLMF